jgi:tRNA (guanine-N7-)-methyltransferase
MQREPTEDLQPYFLTLNDLNGLVDWKEFFANDNPVELDVGSGRGLFLVNATISRPETNFLGIEIDYREGRHAARKLQKRELPNGRVWGGDGRIAFDKHIRPQSVAAIHVYFPDPWWKKKHRRRRVFTDELVDQMVTALVSGGFVHSWTDVEDYFEVIQSLMDNDTRFETMPQPVEREAQHDLDYQTSFERKKRQAGCPIYRGLWRLQNG